MTTKNGELLLTPEELAERWQISTQTLYNWRCQKTGFFKCVKIGSKTRYRLSDVKDYESRKQ